MIRLLHTLRHLRLRQIFYQVYYRLTDRLSENGARTNLPGKLLGSLLDTGGQVTIPNSFGVQSKVGATPVLPPLAEDLRASANALPVRYTEAGFCFLHRTVHFPSFGAIDWNFAEHGKLWTYNLNYFEYLRQPGLDPDVGEQLIGAWITEDTTHLDGWEPYPISLRLVNWLQFYRSCGRPVPARVRTSILRQYVALWRKREYHLGGNHLLENAIALSLTARYLNDPKGKKKADRLLRAELKEQYLPDGAHFELSVMYHLILLWRLLDLYSFLSATDSLKPILAEALHQQLSWANYIITPGGHYPHFNDSTNGIAPDWAAVKAYATALGLSRSPDELPADVARRKDASDERKPRSGLVRKDITLEFSPPTPPTSPTSATPPTPPTPPTSPTSATSPTSPTSPTGGSLPAYQPPSPPDYLQTTLWIDAAQIGPTYIPGHAHADNLTFVLSHNGQPIIVDPSISTYEKNTRRAWERSTAAHNTVVVNDQNSSDVWGGFRVGKRASTYVYKDTDAELVAEHDGYATTSHLRTFKWNTKGITITDELTGEHTAGVARLHFAPGLQPEIVDEALEVGGLRFTFAGATSLELFDYQCAQGFNLLEDGVGVRVGVAGQLTTRITVFPGL